MSDTPGPGQRWTIDELAHRRGLPTRTVREYQRLGLLPPPGRRGRVGVYDDEHDRRLALIARLQERGYSLAGIRDLIDAWAAGETLDSVLGGAGLDEAAEGFTLDELVGRAAWLAAAGVFRAAVRCGLVREGAEGRWYVRSPSLLSLVDDAVAAGAEPSSVLDAAGAMRDAARHQAAALAAVFVDQLWGNATSGELERLGRRSRVHAARAAGALIVDELGLAVQDAAARRDDADLAMYVASMRLRAEDQATRRKSPDRDDDRAATPDLRSEVFPTHGG